jgi:hypothetical protein
MTTLVPTDIRNEALQKIGRNVVKVQKLEAALKTLVIGSDVRGYASDFAERHGKRIKDISRRPMGRLVDDFFNSIHSDIQRAPESPEKLDEAWMSFTLRISTSKEAKQEQKAALSLLVRERNILIHERLAAFDPDSGESCEALIQFLDEQHERLEPPRIRLMQFVADLEKVHAEIVAVLKDKILALEKEEDDLA